jgi:hypothetical protein
LIILKKGTLKIISMQIHKVKRTIPHLDGRETGGSFFYKDRGATGWRRPGVKVDREFNGGQYQQGNSADEKKNSLSPQPMPGWKLYPILLYAELGGPVRVAKE